MKILIVDDDVIIRQGLSEGIDWPRHGFELIGAAGDGEEALELMKLQTPDIVISDIRMPFMDGLELAERMNEMYPWVKLVLLTGYQEYEYAKKAIEMRASEYLIKPIQNMALLQKVIELGAQIEQERTYSRQVQEGMPLLRQRYLQKLVMGAAGPDYHAEIKFLGLPLHQDVFHVMVVKIDGLHSPELLKRYSEKEIIKYCVHNIARELLGERGLTFDCEDDEIAAIVTGNTDPKALFERAYAFAEELLEQVKRYVKTTITIGMGGAYEGYEKLAKSYQEARSSLAYRHYTGTSQIITVHDTGLFADLNELHLAGLKKELYAKVKLGLTEDALAVVNQLERKLFETQLEWSRVHLLVVEIAVVVFQGMQEWEEEAGSHKDFYTVSKELQELETVADIFRYLRAFVEGVTRDAMKVRESQTKGVVLKAMEYIDRHFSNENLYLQEVAGAVHVNPTYLSIIFKREKEINFSDYLLEVRMKKAIQLIRKGELKSYEVAQQVGYPNPQYFSVVFKKYTGYSPTESRNAAARKDA